MATVCLYFQLHQPYRLRRYAAFETATDYFDDATNARILDRVCTRSYLPAIQLLGELCDELGDDFRMACSATGVLLEQLAVDHRDAHSAVATLARRPNVEWLAETYFHSLASLFSESEFAEQVALQSAVVTELAQTPATTFRNTELIYSNDVADQVRRLGFQTMLAEGCDDLLAGDFFHRVRRHQPAAGTSPLTVLLRSFRLSDDIAFRFHQGLTAEAFAARVSETAADVVGVFLDLEVLGEHMWAETGIFEFFRHLPRALLEAGHSFATPASLAKRADLHRPIQPLDVPSPKSWADTARDVSAWLGNGMQRDAARNAYALENDIKASGDAALLRDWRRLTLSDHYYYMSTKAFDDGAVHQYFNPYDSPYDAYLNYMNVLDNFMHRMGLSQRREAARKG